MLRLLILLSQWYHYNLSCGMATHIEVTHRAMLLLPSTTFNRVLSQNLPAVEAGSFFPDWGYNCGKLGKPSEYSHWPSFYLHAINYMYEQYPQPLAAVLNGTRSSDTVNQRKLETLLGFLFGVVSHGTADITWHSLDQNSQGLIDAFSKSDWQKDYGTAHTIADVGGEFLLARNVQLDYIQRAWTVPSDDLAAIYQRMGMKEVTPIKVTGCMTLGYSATQAIRIGGRRLVGKQKTDESPFLLMNHEAYFRGGLQNMASWVAYCWGDLILYLQGTKQQGFCNLQFPKYTQITRDHPDQGTRNQFVNDDTLVQVRHQHDKEFVNIEDEITPIASEMNMADTSSIACKPLGKKITTLTITPDLSPFARFGTKILTAPLSSDKNVKHLIVSAPYQPHNVSEPGYSGLGSVFIYSLVDKKEQLLMEITSPPSYATESKFGFGLASLDYNQDGIMDLIVSAPSASFNQHELYRGAIYIYLGGKLSNQPDFTLLPPKEMVNDNNPRGFLTFGEHLFTMDINNDGKLDLLVGSPTFSSRDKEQDGMVCAYLSDKLYSTEPSWEPSWEPTWCRTQNESYEHFGSSIIYINPPQLGPGLLIGAPGYSSNSVGRVVFTPLENGYPKTDPITLIIGSQPHMRLGSNLQINNNQLYVSAPTQSQSKWLSGSVYSINLDQLKINPDLINTIHSKQPGGLLGSSLVTSSTSGIFISEPLGDWERGNIFYLPNHQPSSPKCFNLGDERDRLGTHLFLSDINQDNKPDLILSSPHARPQGHLHIVWDVHHQLNTGNTLLNFNKLHTMLRLMSIVGLVWLI